MLLFDERALLKHLSRLPNSLRVAFAICCAQRLLPAYQEFAARTGRGDGAILDGILVRAWNAVIVGRFSRTEAGEDLELCMGLIPIEDDQPYESGQAYAEDAASATACALRALVTGEPQEAVWAARRAYEAADYYVTHQLGLTDESTIVENPVIQAELTRQRRDLDDLLQSTPSSAPVLAALRERAENEAAGFPGTN